MTNTINDNTNDVMKDIAAYTVPEQYDMTYEELKALIEISGIHSSRVIKALSMAFKLGYKRHTDSVDEE